MLTPAWALAHRARPPSRHRAPAWANRISQPQLGILALKLGGDIEQVALLKPISSGSAAYSTSSSSVALPNPIGDGKHQLPHGEGKLHRAAALAGDGGDAIYGGGEIGLVPHEDLVIALRDDAAIIRKVPSMSLEVSTMAPTATRILVGDRETVTSASRSSRSFWISATVLRGTITPADHQTIGALGGGEFRLRQPVAVGGHGAQRRAVQRLRLRDVQIDAVEIVAVSSVEMANCVLSTSRRNSEAFSLKACVNSPAARSGKSASAGSGA